MSKVKIDLGAKVKKTKALEVTAEPLVIDIALSPRVIAEAMRSDLKQQIETQPGSRWDKSGDLKNGLSVSADGTEIHAPDDRLNRADLRERFRAEVMTKDSLTSKAATKAIGDWLLAMLGGR